MSDKKHKKEGKLNEKQSENQKPADNKANSDNKNDTNNKTFDNKTIIDDLTNTLKHLQAEFDNYRKRTEKDNANFIRISNEELIKGLLPVIDNFELALKSAHQKDEFYKGMELIYSQLLIFLQDNGLKCIECDCKFDPYYHEVLLTEESSKENNTILEELQKGYILNDKVIRHSKVKIAKKKAEYKQEEEKENKDKEE